MCKVILAGLEKYETDAVYVSSDNYLIAEAMGGQVLLPIDEPPRLLKTPAATIEEAVTLPPLHITDGRIPVILEARNMSCDYTISLKAFQEGRLLFGAWALTEIQSLRNCEQDFGVLPFPKYDEAQKNYHCIISTGLTPAVSIPITNPNPSQAGLILEAMAYYSVDTVTHAYYDLSLNSRFIRDEESSEMFDIMFANSVYDFGYIIDVGGLGMILRICSITKRTPSHPDMQAWKRRHLQPWKTFSAANIKIKQRPLSAFWKMIVMKAEPVRKEIFNESLYHTTQIRNGSYQNRRHQCMDSRCP